MFTLITAPAQTASISTGYDMRAMLAQPHPFANQTGTRWRPHSPTAAAPAAQVPTTAPVRPIPVAAPAPKPMSAATASQPMATGTTSRGQRNVGDPWTGVIQQISLGALAHDQGPFSSNKEGGVDTHVEIRFVSPKFLDLIWSPYPHIGANINSSGDTSQVFIGLSYEWEFWGNYFAGFSLGGAWHDGETTNAPLDRKELGCSILFRESINVGYRFTKHQGIGLHLDHISNAKLCDTNEGLENVGVRYSYRF